VSGRPSLIRHRRQLVAASVGNAVEWFDWYVYALLAVYFSGQFFPPAESGSLVPLLSALAIFAVGFFVRPLGGLFAGHLADRFGRCRDGCVGCRCQRRRLSSKGNCERTSTPDPVMRT
jgi:MHS family alpha-ketoglutarate permease-like MFS transporter